MAYYDNKPALQNIPIRTEAGRRIRDAFLPPKGFVYVCPDYSAIELRIYAQMVAAEKARKT